MKGPKLIVEIPLVAGVIGALLFPATTLALAALLKSPLVGLDEDAEAVGKLANLDRRRRDQGMRIRCLRLKARVGVGRHRFYKEPAFFFFVPVEVRFFVLVLEVLVLVVLVLVVLVRAAGG